MTADVVEVVQKGELVCWHSRDSGMGNVRCFTEDLLW